MMMKQKQTCVPNPTSSAALGMHKNSQIISKVGKPSVRIIHIYAPKIIKTDVANFRELVQALTGKQPTVDQISKTKSRKEDESRALSNNNIKPMMATKKMEFRERIKEEEEMMWGGGDKNSGGGFLGGFADLDGFMQEIGGFSLLPLDASHMDAFGETTQLASC